MIGSFGPIIFGASPIGGLTTFDGFEKRFKSRYSTHDIHLGMPVTEFTGYELMEVSFKMNFLAPYTMAPSMGIALLEESLKIGIPYPLLIGYAPIGRGASLFIITELGERLKYFDRNGGIMGAEIDVKLQEYSIPSLSSGIIGQVAQFI